MAIYPAALPTSADIADAGANLDDNPHSVLHDDMRDEIVAICAELGVDPAGSATTVKARLDRVENRTFENITPTSPYSGTFYVLRAYPWIQLVFFLTRTSATTNGPVTLGTLPAGYRPTFGLVPFAATYVSTGPIGTTVAGPASMTINTTGTIVLESRVENIVAIRGSAMWSVTP